VRKGKKKKMKKRATVGHRWSLLAESFSFFRYL
jgi:hypothetical protein